MTDMVHSKFMPEFLKILRARREEIGRTAAFSAAYSAKDPEEALRLLMTRRIPLLDARAADPLWRKECFEMLLSLQSAAAGDDLKYLDSFNVFYETVYGDSRWNSDPGWEMVMRAYDSALSSHIGKIRIEDERR